METSKTTEYAPLISVIVPVYNSETWLNKCLDSICSQSYRNLQIVCVDDGSTDSSLDILTAWAAKDNRICVISKENGGVSSARNAGLDAAEGEYIASVDSDDYLLPGIYEKVVARLTPDCDLLAFCAEQVDELGNPVDSKCRLVPAHQNLHFSLPPEGVYDSNWLKENPVSPCLWDKFMRRSIIVEQHLRFADGIVYEDDAFLRMFTPYVRTYYSFPEVGYMYVQRAGSIMHTPRDYFFKSKENLAVADLMYAYNISHDVSPMAWDNFLDSVARAVPLVKGAAPSKEVALQVRRDYTKFIEEHQLAERFPGDHRLEYMTSAVYGWQKLFISRSYVHKTYKFMGIPVLKFEYNHGRRVAVHTFFSLTWELLRKLSGKK